MGRGGSPPRVATATQHPRAPARGEGGTRGRTRPPAGLPGRAGLRPAGRPPATRSGPSTLKAMGRVLLQRQCVGSTEQRKLGLSVRTSSPAWSASTSTIERTSGRARPPGPTAACALSAPLFSPILPPPPPPPQGKAVEGGVKRRLVLGSTGIRITAAVRAPDRRRRRRRGSPGDSRRGRLLRRGCREKRESRSGRAGASGRRGRRPGTSRRGPPAGKPRSPDGRAQPAR